jgi:hypothetical protein
MGLPKEGHIVAHREGLEEPAHAWVGRSRGLSGASPSCGLPPALRLL